MDLSDIAIDFSESALDLLTNNVIIESIPIVKCIKGAANLFISLRERHLLKNTLVFLQELSKENRSDNILSKYRKKFNNKRIFNEELERLLFIIDKQTHLEKVKMIANYFKAVVDEMIDYDTFLDYIDIVDRLLWNDIKLLNTTWQKINGNGLLLVEKNSQRYFDRISSQGIGEIVFSDNADNAVGNFEYYFDEYSMNFITIGLHNIRIINNRPTNSISLYDKIQSSTWAP